MSKVIWSEAQKAQREHFILAVAYAKGGTSTNLILNPNPGFEAGTNWTPSTVPGFPGTSYWRSGWGTATPHSGSYAYSISNQAYGCIFHAPISVTPNSQYDVSAWVRGQMDPTTFPGAGWLLYAQFYNSSGQFLSDLSIVGGSDPSSISTTWSQKSGRITVPANAATMIVFPHFYLASGWVTYDDLSVVQVGTTTNLVPNPEFLSMTYKQDLSNEIQVEANKAYSLSALVQANGSNATGNWGVRIHYYDSAHNLMSNTFTDITSANNATVTPTGQTIGGQFTTPANAAYMRISLSSALTSGTLTIGNVSLSLVPDATKYYFAGAARVAMRTNGALTYLLSDHLGSTSLTTDASGNKTSELHYDAWGKVRSAWTASTSLPTQYTFTGQFSYMDDPTTLGATEGFGLMFYNARWYDPYLNHFTQPDSIVPNPYNPQAYDRYSYSRNNPVRYNDPSGHNYCDQLNNNNLEDCTSGEQRIASITRKNIPSWDQAFIKNVKMKDISQAEAAYNHFMNNPLQFAEYYVNPRNAPLEYNALDLFAGYSVFHTDADTLILNRIAAGYGVDAAERLAIAQLRNFEQSLTGNTDGNNSITALAALSALVIPLGRGSTGRTVPLTLEEQLAMEQVMADPLNGAIPLKVNMTDPKWPGSEGWEKWASNVNGTEIHFNYNPVTGEFDDFKFK